MRGGSMHQAAMAGARAGDSGRPHGQLWAGRGRGHRSRYCPVAGGRRARRRLRLVLVVVVLLPLLLLLLLLLPLPLLLPLLLLLLLLLCVLLLACAV